jgi:hypothetical protein
MLTSKAGANRTGIFNESLGNIIKEETVRYKSVERTSNRMNPKVLETWINETL